MGALDNTVKQLILVKADTSAARAEIRQLRGEEKKAAQARLAEVEASNRAIDDQLKRWTKIGATLLSAYAAVKVAQAATKAYLEDVRLASSAAGISVDRLQKATRGLVEQDKLLAFAGRTMHGVWRLNQQEMEIVLRGADALAKKTGQELTPVLDALTDSITKGTGAALKDLGIEVKDKTDLMRIFGREAHNAGKGGTTAAEKMQQATIQWKDSVDELIGQIGKLVIELRPMFELLAKVVGLVARAAAVAAAPKEHARGTVRFLRDALVSGGLKGEGGQVLADGADFGNIGTKMLRDIMTRNAAHAEMGKLGAMVGLEWMYTAQDALTRGMVAMLKNKVKKKGAGRELTDTGDVIGGFSDLYGAHAGALGSVGSALAGTFQGARGFQSLGDPGGQALSTAGFQKDMLTVNQLAGDAAGIAQRAMAQAQAQKNTNFLENIFGPLDQFNAYAAGFQLLQGAVTSAFDAWITGQQSIGEAVKAAIATGLKAVAIDAGIQALKNTAYGFAALATGPIGGVSASGFFTAAAQFAGVATVAGLAAKSMHSAGWAGGTPSGGVGSSSSAGAGSFLGSSDTGGGGGNNQVVVMLGSDFGMLTTIEQKTLLRSAIRVGLQGGRSTRRVRRGS